MPTMAHRPLTQIEADIAQRTNRHAALTTRAGEANAELAELRERHARALADGETPLNKAKTATLSVELDGIARALQLLADDLRGLATEKAAALRAEAADVEQLAIAQATARATALDDTVRAFLTEQLLPSALAFDAALTAARKAATRVDALRRQAGAPENTLPNRAEKVTHRRGALLHVVQALRTYAAHVAETTADDAVAEEISAEEVADVVA